MIILLSPAKTLDFEPHACDLPGTKPTLHAQARQLASVAKGLSTQEVAELMEISDPLAEKAHGYLQAWKAKWDPRGAKHAVFAFRGDVYQGLDADTLSVRQLEQAQRHVRILSGLYGVLRPLDLIQPYRLEMGRALANPRGRDLYAWWGDRVRRELDRAFHDDAERTFVNLASNEYARVAQLKQIDARVVTPVFKERKSGAYQVISFFAKRARGAMARHLVRSPRMKVAAVSAFKSDGYRYDPGQSTPDAPVFLRDSPST